MSRIKAWMRFCLCFCWLSAMAQESQKSTRVEIINANSLEFDEDLGNGAKRLIGNVVFKQDEVLMYADSAYYYDNNTLDAFSNVHINKQDTLHLYGDFLHYEGNTRTAHITGKTVKLLDRKMTLTTRRLDYEMNPNIGYYTSGGKIVDAENTLESELGNYHASEQNFYFRKNVVLTNPDYVVTCDTLRYNTGSETAYFLGPTHMKGDNTRMYCENGWYATKINQSRFSMHAWLKNKGQKITGDSLFYNGETEYGLGINHVTVTDSAKKIEIKGDRVEYFGTDDWSFVTGKAEMLQFFKTDTLHLHADTLVATYDSVYFAAKRKFLESHPAPTVKETPKLKNKKQKSTGNPPKKTGKSPVFRNDSLATQHRLVRAYYHVKFYKPDLQGICDSLSYVTMDSMMYLFRQPVLWSNENQLKGESIRIKLHDGDIYNLYLDNAAFIASQVDSGRFNQIKGKKMTGFFKDNDLQKIKVSGNGQTVYFARDRKDKLVGVNRADCSDMLIFMKDEQVEKINMYRKPSGTMYPVMEAPASEIRLKDFVWLERYRPSTAADIFTWIPPDWEQTGNRRKKKSK